MTGSTFSGYSIVVSVDKNADDSFVDLGSQVIADGEAIEATLTNATYCSYLPNRVVRLSGPNTSLNEVEAAFCSAKSDVGEEDPFLFYFSGHGDYLEGEAFLVPFDGEGGVKSSMISSSRLAQLMSKIPSRRKLIILDACFSGGLSVGKSMAKTARAIPHNLISEMSGGEGVVAIASSRASEESLVLYGDTNSLFTKYVLLGLNGAAGHDSKGFVKVFDLFNFVAEQVRHEAPEQSPVYAAYQQDSNFPVAFCADESKRKSATLTLAPNGLSHLKQAVEVFSSLYPQGPLDQEIWSRSGGDIAGLDLSGNGRTMWFRALRDVEMGSKVTLADLISETREDYPYNRRLGELGKLTF